MQGSLRRRVQGGVSLLTFLSIGILACAAQDLYWTNGKATERQFRRASRSCNQQAVLTVADESGGACSYNTEGRGTFCRRSDPSDPFEAEEERRRKERRLRFLYGECLESKGWVANSEGQGFKGKY